MPKTPDIPSMFVGGTQVSAIMFQGGVVWPLGNSYVVENPVLHYSQGDVIYANASNYAYITGTVKTFRGSVLISTQTDVVLVPTLDTPTTDFSVDGNYIRANDLGSTEVTTQKSIYVGASYGGSAIVAVGYVYQQTNTEQSRVLSGTSVTCSPQSLAPLPPKDASVRCYGYLDRTFTITWTSGHTSTQVNHTGSISVTLDGSSLGTINDGEYIDVALPENQTLSEKSYTLEMSYSTYSDSKTLSQDEGYYTYATPVISGYDTSDVPAGGGTTTLGGTATQTYGWNGSTSGIGSLTSSPSWTTPSFSGADLTNNPKERALLGTTIGSVTMNGKTATTGEIAIYQEANVLESTEQVTSDTIYLSVPSWTTQGTACEASGNTISFSASASRVTTTYGRYTSDPNIRYIISQTTPTSVTPSISVSGSGLSRSGVTLTWAPRGKVTGGVRSGSITATTTYNSDSVTLYQAQNRLLSTEYSINLALSKTSFSASADSASITSCLLVTTTTYDSGSYTDTEDGTSLLSLSGSSAFSFNPSRSAVVVSQNLGYSSRSATLSLVWSAAGKSKNISLTQVAGAVCPITATITLVPESTSASSFAYQIALSADSSVDSIQGADVIFILGGQTITDAIEDRSVPSTFTRSGISGNAYANWAGASAKLSGVAYLGPTEIGEFEIDCTITPALAYISASPSSVPKTASSVTLTLKSAYSWTLSNNRGWTISPTSGSKGISSATLSVPANTGTQRSVVVTLAPSSGESASATVVQAAGDEIPFTITDSTSDAGTIYGDTSDGQTGVLSGTAYNTPGWYIRIWVENSDTSAPHSFYIGTRSSPIASIVVAPEESDYMELTYANVASLGGALVVQQSV